MTPILDSKAKQAINIGLRVAGFTLLELLMVLTIIAMASVLVVPNLGSLDTRTFNAQTRQATSLLNYARRIAVVSGQPSTASFYVDLDAEESAEAFMNEARSSVGRWQSAGTVIRYRDSTDREIEVEEKIEITFYPEGGSTGGTLSFSQDDLLVNITVDPFTGRISQELVEDEG